MSTACPRNSQRCVSSVKLPRGPWSDQVSVLGSAEIWAAHLPDTCRPEVLQVFGGACGVGRGQACFELGWTRKDF